jgi:maltose alpha-D-glucosyltransferase/alpha-amylase
METLDIDNPAVLAYWRVHGPERLLCLYNLSNQQQSISLDLTAFRGRTLVDLLAEDETEILSEWPTVKILAPYASHWLSLEDS